MNQQTPEPDEDRSSASKEIEAEKLLLSLDLERNHRRAERSAGLGNRNLFRVLSLVIILGGAMLALYLLSVMLAEVPRPGHSPEPQSSVTP